MRIDLYIWQIAVNFKLFKCDNRIKFILTVVYDVVFCFEVHKLLVLEKNVLEKYFDIRKTKWVI
jgi:hypothetical protein